jgi:hypothetical protein
MKKLNTLILVSTLIFGNVLKAEEISLVAIDRPSALNEGTQRELTAAQVAELLPWAKDSKSFLVDLVDNVQSLNTSDRVERIIEGIKSSVIESAPKNSELLMRYALNRAVVINEILDREMDPNAVGTVDAKSRVLISSINMALKYYDADMATLSQRTASPFATFGMEYFAFLTDLNKSIFDASAQYNIQRTSLEWLQWDLYRDLNNATFAPQILKINNALKTFPTKKISDSQSISFIRQMKKVTEQLHLANMPKVQTKEQSSQILFSKDSGKTTPRREEREYGREEGRFYYSTSKYACYRLSANNDIMYDSKVSDINCFGGSYYYSTSKYQCFMVSSSNDIMYSAHVSDEKCSGGSYYYSTSKYQCYKVSKSNDIMYSSRVEDDKCAADSFYYSTSKYKCYKVSKSNDIMYSSEVDDNNCASGSYYYNSSKAQCYKTSKSNDIMYSSPVGSTYCR